MRLRNIPRADGVIDAHRAVIKKPEEQRGQWAQVFGNEKPIQIEIGMGKGQFILNMAKAHPEINFIGIERYSSVLLRALEKYDTEEFENLENIRFICMDAREIEADTQRQIQEIRDKLEAETSRILSGQSQESQDELNALQKEYNEKHSDYAHEILRRITEV